MAAREDQIEASVAFLQNPTVADKSVTERIQFLSSKGVSEAEIRAALERTGLTVEPAAVAQSPLAPLPLSPQRYAPAVVERPLWERVLVPMTLALSAGSGMAFLYRFFGGASPGARPPPGPPPLPVQEPLPSVTPNAGDPPSLSNSMLLPSEVSTALASVVEGMRLQSANVDKLLQNASAIAERNDLEVSRLAEVSDIKAELASIKTLLLAQGLGNNSSMGLQNVSSIVAQQEDEDETPESRLAELRATLDDSFAVLEESLLKLDDKELNKSACDVLLMFLKNLLKDPGVPRYRKISTTNTNFKSALENVDGVVDMLNAVGFRGTYGGILEVETKWKDSLCGDGESDELPDKWANTLLTHAISKLEVARAREFTSATPTAAPEDAPTYPSSFSDVVKMTEQGIRPPDVKDIPNTLSATPASAPSGRELNPPRPWMQQQPQQQYYPPGHNGGGYGGYPQQYAPPGAYQQQYNPGPPPDWAPAPTPPAHPFGGSLASGPEITEVPEKPSSAPAE